MNRIVTLVLALSLVAGCGSGGGNPLQEDAETEAPAEPADPADPADPIDSRGLPPGTAQPTPNNAIVRYEADDDEGGGYARNIEYNNDQGQDEFIVDNIAFDGDNSYVRGGSAQAVNAVGQLGPFAVYEGDETTTDPLTGNTIGTFTYRAIYGRSTSGQTEFAIVRSGSYIDYGFGGFIYQRNNVDANGDNVRLVLPTEGDAEYLGDYAGVWIFDGGTGLNYVTGDAQIFVDFKDFNDNQRGVALFVHNRRLYDIDGNDVTQNYLTAVNEASGTDSNNLVIETDGNGNAVLPDINPIISPDMADGNGEIVGDVQSIASFDDGSTVTAGEGTFYAIMSGTDAEEIVGVLVMTGDDPRRDGTTYQETGGFIVYRQ